MSFNCPGFCLQTCRSRSMPTYSAVDDPEGSGYCLLGDRSVNFNEVNHLGDEGSTCRTRANQPMTDDIVNGGSEELVTGKGVVSACSHCCLTTFCIGLEFYHRCFLHSLAVCHLMKCGGNDVGIAAVLPVILCCGCLM